MLGGGAQQRQQQAPPPYTGADIGEITPFEEFFTPYSDYFYQPPEPQTQTQTNRDTRRG